MSLNDQTTRAVSKTGQPARQKQGPNKSRKQDTKKILLDLRALQVTNSALPKDGSQESTTRRKSAIAEAFNLVQRLKDRDSRKIATDREEAIISDPSKLRKQILRAEIDPLAHQSMYDRVAWFDICWKDSDLNCESELLEFAKWRENCLFHEVVTFRIPANFTPEWVKVETELFLRKYGLDSTGRTLAIINYGGHGGLCSDGLKLVSHKSGKQSLDWSVIENLVTQATSDILIILDCCNAGNFIKSTLGKTRKPSSSARGAQRIEVLGACHARQTTWAAGPGTFTYRLAKVMAKFRYAGEDMSTETLNHEMYRLYESEEEIFNPFQLTLKKGHGQSFNLAPLYNKEFRELQLNFEQFPREELNPSRFIIIVLRDGRGLTPEYLCGEYCYDVTEGDHISRIHMHVRLDWAENGCGDLDRLEECHLRYGDVILSPHWTVAVLSRIRHIFTKGSSDLPNTYVLKLVVPFYDSTKTHPRFDFSYQGCCRKHTSGTCQVSDSWQRNCSWTVWNTKNRIKMREMANEKNRLKVRELRNGTTNTDLSEIENFDWETSETPVDIDDSLGSVYAPPVTTPRDLKIEKSLVPHSWRSELDKLSRDDTLDRKQYDDWKSRNPGVGEPLWDSDSLSESEEEGEEGGDSEDEHSNADQTVWDSGLSSEEEEEREETEDEEDEDEHEDSAENEVIEKKPRQRPKSKSRQRPRPNSQMLRE